MNIHVYDGSFEGLLSVVFDAYASGRFPDALYREEDVPPLLGAGARRVFTGRDKAARVHAGLAGKLSKNALEGLVYAWLSEEPGLDFTLFRYIRKVFDSPFAVEGKLTDSDVAAVTQAARLSAKEAHLMLGFARFQKTSRGVYFAGIAPRRNVLVLMLPHFADRFADQQWILYDTGRGYGVYFEGGRFQEVSLDEAAPGKEIDKTGRLPEELLADNERLFQNLWQTYFEATAIRERHNPRLHARCLPRRYWAQLTEKQR